jgi:hypothetical protein
VVVWFKMLKRKVLNTIYLSKDILSDIPKLILDFNKEDIDKDYLSAGKLQYNIAKLQQKTISEGSKFVEKNLSIN